MSETGAAGIRLTDTQRLAWLRLIRSANVGPMTFRTLINQYGNAEAALAALPDLARRGGREGLRPASLDDASRELDAVAAIGGRLVGIGEPEYPPWLRQIHAPPPLLTLLGNADVCALPAIAIVGARNASVAGRKMAGMLAHDLGKAGFVVVSGLARGIDAAAHAAAIDTGTIAVFAGGIDIVYPAENRELAETIFTRGGCALTEMPYGTTPRAREFPRRNRIIAGMAVATVVVEAALRSGSLITARLALEENREVLAVPGSPLDPRAAGANRLIRQGATLITDATDVLEVVRPLLAIPPPPSTEIDSPSENLPPPEPATADRNLIAEALGPSPVAVDELVRFTGLPARIVAVTLLELDLAGRLEWHPGNRVSMI